MWGCFLQRKKRDQLKGVKRDRSAKCREDQKTLYLGWVYERLSMWNSLCGSEEQLTSGLHYKREALWGFSDLCCKYKGVAEVPASSDSFKSSSDTQEYNPKKVCMGVGWKTPTMWNLNDLLVWMSYSLMACFISSPSFAWMKCSLYLGKTRARLQNKDESNTYIRQFKDILLLCYFHVFWILCVGFQWKKQKKKIAWH